jgi:hypothetical protein
MSPFEETDVRGRENEIQRVAKRNSLGAALAGSFLVGSLLGGCAGDSTGPETRREVTLHGFLYVGEQVTAANAIRLGRVGAIDEAYDPAAAAIDGARVLLRKEGAAQAETLWRVEAGAYANERIRIEPRTTYHLTAELPDGPILTAATTTPSVFTAYGGPPVTPDSVRYETLSDRHPIDVECADSTQIFLCDVYCRSGWSEARYINPFGDHDRPNDEAEYGGANGEPRHIFAYFRIQDVGPSGDGNYRIDFYSAMMAFYGRYDVNILSVDENTYRWLYRDYPEENGGVEGGIGVFGSACRRAWSVQVVD